ncbi:hypothetical protein [Bartonella sp. LJL80]
MSPYNSNNPTGRSTDETVAQPLTPAEIEGESDQTMPDMVDAIEESFGQSLEDDPTGSIADDEIDMALRPLQNEDHDLIDDNLYEGAPDPSQAE